MNTTHARLLGLVTLPLLLLASPISHAAGQLGWYYGASVGESQADLSQPELDEFSNTLFAIINVPVAAYSSTLEDTDTSWSIFFGYQFSPFLAFEAGYSDFGEYRYRYRGNAGTETVDFDFRSKGFPVAAIATLPIGLAFDLQARAGFLFSDTELAVSAISGPTIFRGQDDASGSEFYYGVGGALNLGDSWSFRLDWQQFKDVGDEDITTETDIDLLSLSVIYRLGPM